MYTDRGIWANLFSTFQSMPDYWLNISNSLMVSPRLPLDHDAKFWFPVYDINQNQLRLNLTKKWHLSNL